MRIVGHSTEGERHSGSAERGSETRGQRMRGHTFCILEGVSSYCVRTVSDSSKSSRCGQLYNCKFMICVVFSNKASVVRLHRARVTKVTRQVRHIFSF